MQLIPCRLSVHLHHQDYKSIVILMQGPLSEQGVRSPADYMAITSHQGHQWMPPAGVIQSGVQTCFSSLLILQKGWNVCDNISWRPFMWLSLSVEYVVFQARGKGSTGQREARCGLRSDRAIGANVGKCGWGCLVALVVLSHIDLLLTLKCSQNIPVCLYVSVF